MTWKCSLGLHNWQLQKVIEYSNKEYDLSYCTPYLDSYVCQTCGKSKDTMEKLTVYLPYKDSWVFVKGVWK